ncbi:unnamed protein product [Anisakis simplex]|uniref:G_PROTEIN_RECEP_F1_2 domain-containing protein n=1 Tax=Anisakis simplex TaxID=6269 RepID=A0A0M3KEM6_ANISI|nr:unnamed protein product [Anisakis simplex]
MKRNRFQSNTKKLQQSDSSMQSQRYIAFLTITFLLFFLIPLCASSALYYSVAEHIKKKQQVKSFSLNLYSHMISNNTTSNYASMSNGNNAHDGNITNNADKNDHKQKSTIAPWTPATHHISKSISGLDVSIKRNNIESKYVLQVCLSCLLVTAVPYLPYALICLNPFDADTTRINLIAIPLLSARFSALLAPFTFIW